MSARVIGRGHLVVGAPRHVGRPPSPANCRRRAARHALPADPGRALRPEWPSWRQILAPLRWRGRNRRSAARPRHARRIQAGAARRDPPLGRDAGHLGEEQARAALARARRNGRGGNRSASRPPPNTSPSARRRRGSRASFAQLERREHRRRGLVDRLPARLRLEPALDAFQPVAGRAGADFRG